VEAVMESVTRANMAAPSALIIIVSQFPSRQHLFDSFSASLPAETDCSLGDGFRGESSPVGRYSLMMFWLLQGIGLCCTGQINKQTNKQINMNEETIWANVFSAADC